MEPVDRTIEEARLASANNLHMLNNRNKLYEKNYRTGEPSRLYEVPGRSFGDIQSEYKEKFIQWPLQALNLTIPHPHYPPASDVLSFNDPKHFNVRFASNGSQSFDSSDRIGNTRRGPGVYSLSKEQAPHMFAWSLQDRHANVSAHDPMATAGSPQQSLQQEPLETQSEVQDRYRWLPMQQQAQQHQHKAKSSVDLCPIPRYSEAMDPFHNYRQNSSATSHPISNIDHAYTTDNFVRQDNLKSREQSDMESMFTTTTTTSRPAGLPSVAHDRTPPYFAWEPVRMSTEAISRSSTAKYTGEGDGYDDGEESEYQREKDIIPEPDEQRRRRSRVVTEIEVPEYPDETGTTEKINDNVTTDKRPLYNGYEKHTRTTTTTDTDIGARQTSIRPFSAGSRSRAVQTPRSPVAGGGTRPMGLSEDDDYLFAPKEVLVPRFSTEPPYIPSTALHRPYKGVVRSGRGREEGKLLQTKTVTRSASTPNLRSSVRTRDTISTRGKRRESSRDSSRFWKVTGSRTDMEGTKRMLSTIRKRQEEEEEKVLIAGRRTTSATTVRKQIVPHDHPDSDFFPVNVREKNVRHDDDGGLHDDGRDYDYDVDDGVSMRSGMSSASTIPLHNRGKLGMAQHDRPHSDIQSSTEYRERFNVSRKVDADGLMYQRTVTPSGGMRVRRSTAAPTTIDTDGEYHPEDSASRLSEQGLQTSAAAAAASLPMTSRAIQTAAMEDRSDVGVDTMDFEETIDRNAPLVRPAPHRRSPMNFSRSHRQGEDQQHTNVSERDGYGHGHGHGDKRDSMSVRSEQSDKRPPSVIKDVDLSKIVKSVLPDYRKQVSELMPTPRGRYDCSSNNNNNNDCDQRIESYKMRSTQSADYKRPSSAPIRRLSTQHADSRRDVYSPWLMYRRYPLSTDKQIGRWSSETQLKFKPKERARTLMS
eukprot:gene3871-7721_t